MGLAQFVPTIIPEHGDVDLSGGLSTGDTLYWNGSKFVQSGTSTVRGLNKEVWIAVRTDGISGTGTANDPYDGSTPALLAAVLENATKCPVNAHIHFSAGTFRINAVTANSGSGNSINPRDGWRITGAGMYVTTIQLMGDATGVTHDLIGIGGEASNVVVEDLTIDGNWSEISVHGTAANGEFNNVVSAVELKGSNNIFQRVRHINTYGSNANGRECFALYLAAPTGTAVSNNRIIECIGELPAGTYANPFAVAGDGASFLASNCLVKDCRAYGRTGLGNDGLQAGFTSGGVNFAYVKDLIIAGNKFYDCSGISYIDTGDCDGVIIQHNEAYRAWFGVNFAQNAGPVKQNLIVNDNIITLQQRVTGAYFGIGIQNGVATNVVINRNQVTSLTGGLAGGSSQLWGVMAPNAVNTGTCNDNIVPFANNRFSITSVTRFNNRTIDGTIPGDSEIQDTGSGGGGPLDCSSLNIASGGSLTQSGNSVLNLSDDINTIINPMTDAGAIQFRKDRGSTGNIVFFDGLGTPVGVMGPNGSLELGGAGTTMSTGGSLCLHGLTASQFIETDSNKILVSKNASTFRTDLGATTVGNSLFILGNPGAVSFIKVSALNVASTENASTHRTSLGLAIGADVQAYSVNLDTVAAVSVNAFGAGFLAESSAAQCQSYIGLGYLFSGAGSPEGSITAPVGSRYARTNGGAGTSLYVKESGSGNTGWVAYSSGAGQVPAGGTAGQVLTKNSGTDYDTSWASSSTAIGALVAAAGTAAANGTYTLRGQSNGKDYFNLFGQSDSTTLYAIVWAASQWKIFSSAGARYYYSTEDVAEPWQVVTWTADTGAGPVPTVTATAGGTVTTLSVVTANGVSGTVATATTTPAITLSLGAITPTSVVASGNLSGANLSGTNTGDQTITLTGDVTGTGTGSFAATIGANKVTLAKLATQADQTILGNNSGGTAVPSALSASAVRTVLGLVIGTNVEAWSAVLDSLATNTAPAGTLVGTTDTQELTNKTLTAGVIKTGLTASGSASNDFSGSTGTFKTSTGANTLSGATTIADATTPSLTTASGKTNTGFVLIQGKTSGGLKLISADTAGQTVTVSLGAQTTGAATLSIPDMGGANDTAVLAALAQTLTNKTLTSPKLNENVALTTTATKLNYLTSATGTTGTASTNIVFSTSPTLVTPVLGVATATSVNKWTLTAPSTAATLTAGGDSLTYTLPDITCNIGFREIPQNSKSAGYTTILTDNGKHILHPAADTTARTFTIDSNANVAYPVGTAIMFINQHGAGVLTIACLDTMRLAGTGASGNRTLAADGMATAVKITTTEWIISGNGIS